jgi:hypothetical protein
MFVSGTMTNRQHEWREHNVQEFWNETAPGHHLLQIYDNETVFLNSLEGFAGTGLLAGESVIIVATRQHIDQLAERLSAQGFDLDRLRGLHLYNEIDAEVMLPLILRDGMPDRNRFLDQVKRIETLGLENANRLRLFGEMVVVLASRGETEAALVLEDFWKVFCENNVLTVLCAYPRQLVNQAGGGFQEAVCSCHTRQISGAPLPSTQVLHRKTNAVSIPD